MGSKIRPPGTSMGGPFFSKTWYFDGSIFQHFLKFAPKWRKFGTLIGQLFKIFRNLRQNGANFSEKFWFLVHGWVTFPSKWVHGWVAFQKSQRHTPTQTKVEYPLGLIKAPQFNHFSPAGACRDAFNQNYCFENHIHVSLNVKYAVSISI